MRRPCNPGTPDPDRPSEVPERPYREPWSHFVAAALVSPPAHPVGAVSPRFSTGQAFGLHVFPSAGTDFEL